MSTGNRSLLRRMNSLGLLQELLEGPRSMRELVTVTGLSRTAVDAVLRDLVDMGWVQTTEGVAESRPGRPAALYHLHTELGHVLSIDIGANHIYAVLTDLSGVELGRATVTVEEQCPADERLRSAFATADSVLETAGVERESVWIVAVGSPGAISSDGIVSHFGGSGMPGWVGLDLRSLVADEFHCAALVEGDVALGAQAELAYGAAQQRRDVVYVLCGVRTSGASIIGGRVHRGVHGAAGIVGELPELRWIDLNERYGVEMLGSPRPSREQIFDLARSGDPVALEAVREFADDLALGASALVLALDPELLVIGGGSSPSADVFLPRFETTLRRLCPIAPEVLVSSLGSEAVGRGGVSLAISHVVSVLSSSVWDNEGFPEPADARRLLREVS